MQFTSAKKPPPGIVFDSDFGNRIDSALALGLLHGLEGKNFGKIGSISTSKANLRSAQLAEVIESYYAGATPAFGGISFQAQSIGMSVDGKLPADTPLLTKVLALKDDKGQALYAPRIRKLNDTAIVEALIRNALTANYDRNAVVLLDGPATNLVRVLDLPGAKAVAAAKVKVLVVTGGNFASNEPDEAFRADLKAMRRLLVEWPSPVVFAGREVGKALPYPGASIEKDFPVALVNPIAAAYRAAGAMPYDAPAPALAAALYALRPDEGYFKLSPPGTVEITDDGRAMFHPSATGKHRYLVMDPLQADAIVKLYAELVSAAPVRRARRPPPDAVVEKKN